jgi:hypothetical protein
LESTETLFLLFNPWPKRATYSWHRKSR